MAKVLLLKGLPASGKTTYAKELVAKGWKRVNKDDLRAMLDDSVWSKSNEKLVLNLRDLIIVEALSAGKNVVVDDTNLAPFHQDNIQKLIASFNPVFEVKFFDTPLATCLERDAARDKPVGRKVINDMHEQYLASLPELYEAKPDTPKAIIVDIDGTIAHGTGRSPYDWMKVGEDSVDKAVNNLVTLLAPTHRILMVSGRDSVCRATTVEWLNRHGIDWDQLFMRPEGDTRKDTLIKQEIFDREIRDKYDVQFVLDDRNSVVKMWRDLGLKCLQVQEGNF